MPAFDEHFERGVYEEQVVPPGERWLTIVAASGRVGIVHLPAEMVDASLIEHLWRKVDAGRTKTAPRHLQVVPPSSRPRKSRGKSAPPTLTIC